VLLPEAIGDEEPMIGLFFVGVLLWITGDLMERHELAERRKRLPPTPPYPADDPTGEKAWKRWVERR
jgi:hypothetical protein